ncbi:MAG: flavodoxin domain-containing protein [Candidatus Promineifilaceae bacterium]|jgi:menaquinone-dependent protoporphyrinogen oxidase
MSEKVLVTYATKYGATAEIAEKIAEVLRANDLSTDVMDVKKVKDLAPYSAVVLGSAVYIGRWRKEAVKFMEDNEEALAARDVWIFSSGPTDEGDPVELVKGWTLPEKLEPVAERIQPHDIAVFHGDLDPEKMNFIERTMIKNIKVPTGDFRDWDMITAWATAVAGTLQESTA